MQRTDYEGTVCLPNTSQKDIRFGWVYASSILLIHIYLLFTWIQHRHTFQVRQRSPYLVCLGILFNAYVMLLVPIYFLYSPIKYNPNKYINYIGKEDSHYNTIRYFRSLYIIASTVVWTILIERNIKIFIVLLTKIENKIVKFYFKYECISFLIRFMIIPQYAVFLTNHDLCTDLSFFGHSGQGCENSFWHTQYWRMIHSIENLTMPISFLINLKIPSKFSLNVETFVCFVTYGIVQLLLLIQSNRENQYCIFFLESLNFYQNLRNLINISFIVMYPIYLSKFNKFHYLPSYKQKNDYVVFLLEKQLYTVFNKFIEFQRQQYKKTFLKNLEQYEYSLVYLNYYQFMQIIFTQTDEIKREQTKQQLIDLFLTNQEAYAQNNIDYLIHKLQQCNNTHVDSQYLNDMHNTSLQKIEKYFEDYKKTNSYKIHVTKILKNNSYLNQRLIEFNMESKY